MYHFISYFYEMATILVMGKETKSRRQKIFNIVYAAYALVQDMLFKFFWPVIDFLKSHRFK